MIIAFDLDDTLFSEYDFCRSAYSDIARDCELRYGINERRIFCAMTDAVISHANPFDALLKIYEDANRDSGDGRIRDFNIKEFVEKYRNHKPEYLPLAENAELVLDKLNQSHIKLAIITDGRINTQTAKFNALGLNKYIDSDNLIISEATGFDKTHPHNFKLLMERNAEEKEYIYVADNQAKDFYYPNLLGWHTVCVRHSFQTVHPYVIPSDINYRSKNTIINLKELLTDKIIASGLHPTR